MNADKCGRKQKITRMDSPSPPSPSDLERRRVNDVLEAMMGDVDDSDEDVGNEDPRIEWLDADEDGLSSAALRSAHNGGEEVEAEDDDDDEFFIDEDEIEEDDFIDEE